MAAVHEVGLALALPGGLGRVLTRANRHVNIALIGLRRIDRGLAKLGGSGGDMRPMAGLKRHRAALAGNAGVPASLAPEATRQGSRTADRDATPGQQRRPADPNRTPTREAKPTTANRGIVLTLADGIPRPATGGRQFIPVPNGNGAAVGGTRSARAELVARPAATGVSAPGARRTAEGPLATHSIATREATSPAVKKEAVKFTAVPTRQVAPWKMTMSRRQPGIAVAGSPNATTPERSNPPSGQPTSPAAMREFLVDQDIGPPRPASLPAAFSGFAPARRAAPPSAAKASSATMAVGAPAIRLGSLPSRGEIENPATGTPQGATATQGGNEAVAPAGGGPTQGDVFLDGTLVGRWMARKLAHEAGRPPSGSPAFDPTRSPFPPGRMIGG
jgi:hypothetical protein